jgi:elongation factor P--(R)-beta-lysine ligase
MSLLNKSSLNARRPLLIQRNRLKKSCLSWFEGEGFTEVETPVLQISPGNETHLHGFKTEIQEMTGAGHPLYLHTSPEFAMKKLLSMGETAIFQFAKVYRNRERSRLHHPEFTMLEWYRAGVCYEKLMQDSLALIALAGGLSHGGFTADPAKIHRITYEKAFYDLAGLRLSHLRADALEQGYRIAHDDTDADIRSKLLTLKIEPHFAGNGCVTILDEYPIEEAALARPSPHNPQVAERFEVYACGVELVNGFGELTDAKVQKARFIADMAEKKRIYGEIYPIDDAFIQCLADMPPSAGAALGFDRLVMLATNAPRIEDVLWLPVVDTATL